jgi:hypothetical protein
VAPRSGAEGGLVVRWPLAIADHNPTFSPDAPGPASIGSDSCARRCSAAHGRSLAQDSASILVVSHLGVARHHPHGDPPRVAHLDRPDGRRPGGARALIRRPTLHGVARREGRMSAHETSGSAEFTTDGVRHRRGRPFGTRRWSGRFRDVAQRRSSSHRWGARARRSRTCCVRQRHCFGQFSVSSEGTTLTVSETSNDITGSVTVFGSAILLSPPMSFDGETEVVSCDPATFTISTPAPTGAIVQTLVFVG